VQRTPSVNGLRLLGISLHPRQQPPTPERASTARWTREHAGFRASHLTETATSAETPCRASRNVPDRLATSEWPRHRSPLRSMSRKRWGRNRKSSRAQPILGPAVGEGAGNCPSRIRCPPQQRVPPAGSPRTPHPHSAITWARTFRARRTQMTNPIPTRPGMPVFTPRFGQIELLEAGQAVHWWTGRESSA